MWRDHPGVGLLRLHKHYCNCHEYVTKDNMFQTDNQYPTGCVSGSLSIPCLNIKLLLKGQIWLHSSITVNKILKSNNEYYDFFTTTTIVLRWADF